MAALRREGMSAGPDGRTDVLVIGGGPAGAWAAIAAAEAGRRGDAGRQGLPRHQRTPPRPPTPAPGACPPASTAPKRWRAAGSAPWASPTSAGCCASSTSCYENLQRLVEWGYPFPTEESGLLYTANLRGPDYMRFMRARVLRAGVRVLDHHPATELLSDGATITGAAGLVRATGEGLADRGRRHRARDRRLRLLRAHPRRHRADRRRAPDGGRGRRLAVGDGVHRQVHARPVRHLAEQGPAVPLGDLLRRGRGAAPATPRASRWRTASARRRRTWRGRSSRGRSMPGSTWPSRRCRPGCARASRTASCPTTGCGIDPFRDLFRVTLRAEGTVRGTGGIRVTSSECTTEVPGLYAAGDAATRENVAGATSGGGSVNSSWAMSSGWWAGRGAAGFARRRGAPGRLPRRLAPARHRRPAPDRAPARHRPARGGGGGPRRGDPARQELLPRRRAARGEPRAARRRSGARSQAHLAGEGPGQLRAREAAAVTAAARWSLAAALARTESRGMHRRLDLPGRDDALGLSLLVGGLDEVTVRPAGAAADREERAS